MSFGAHTEIWLVGVRGIGRSEHALFARPAIDRHDLSGREEEDITNGGFVLRRSKLRGHPVRQPEEEAGRLEHVVSFGRC